MGNEEAWLRAREAAMAAGVEVRPLATLEEADRILEVMVATWGEHQLLPRELIRALMDSGNEPWGAFFGERMIGYVLGFLGRGEDGPHIHSHMLAVVPEWRSRGVGFALKLVQRAVAIERGVRYVRWTFDPLLSRNAHFNIAKLGAICDGFHRNFYGVMTDVLNRGERSDRLVVRWDVAREATGPAKAEGSVILDREGPEDAPRPAMRETPAAGPALVRIPREYHELRRDHPDLALAWRGSSADALQACFSAGLVVTGFTADSAYVFA